MEIKNIVHAEKKLNPMALFLGLLFLISFNLYGQDTRDSGFKYLRNYSYQEYNHQPQNWGICQASNGLIYIANHGGVLEYDGVSWRIIGIPDYAPVRSIASDKNGTIYVGGSGEIGYLSPDSKGTLQYVSLLDQLDEKQRHFTNVWRTLITEEGIYFCAWESLMRWNPAKKQMKIWSPTNSFLNPFTVNRELFIYQKKIGLMKMVDDNLVPFTKDELFLNENERIFMMIPYVRNSYDLEPDGKLLIGTLLNGFFLYDGISLKPFPTEIDDYLKKNITNHGIRLSSGDYALGTRLGGVVIMGPQGKLKYIFDKTSGLLDDNVKHIMEDKQGNIWLCLDNGISKIEYNSPFFIYDDRVGLLRNVLSVVRQHGDLYAGTTKTLYVEESQSKTFRTIPGIYNSCWCLFPVNDSVLAATTDGVFQIDNKNKTGKKIIEDSAFVLMQSERNPLQIWCGTNHGLISLVSQKDRWIKERAIEKIDQEIRSIAEDRNGNIWLGTLGGIVFKVDCPVGETPPVVRKLDKTQGLPGGEIYVAWAAGNVIFATEKGIYRFDEKISQFIPDETLGKEFMGGAKPVFRVIEDKSKTIWFHSESKNYQAIPSAAKIYNIYSQPFKRIPTSQVNAIYPDPDGKTVWFGNFDGLIRYDTTFKKNYKQDFQTQIRKVFTNDTIIFDGYKNTTGQGLNNRFPIIEYKNRNLRFEFTALFFEAETETEYRCLLEGYDKNWSTWHKEAKMNYTNLDPGWYTFRVQARNVYGCEGSEDTFRFKIMPPWYRTWWAYVFYAIGAFGSIFLFIQWRASRLQYEKQKLEQIVKERTQEIQEKNRQLETQTLKLQDQSEKLKEMDKVKSNFFANISHEFRTPLTLIMSPLEQMLYDSRDKKQKEKFNVMLRSSQQLLTLINQLLDLSRFDSGKTKLQAAYRDIIPFLKGIMESFQGLAQQNQLDLEFNSQATDIPLYFDAPKMEESMYNLLINAFKFTPAGGKITLSTSRDREYVKISVQDTGVGIPKERLPYIFDRFYQAEAPGGKGPKGTGIGLALTREIIQLHHGKIDVHSQEGKGTEFVIQLPIGQSHLKPDEIAAASEIVLNSRKVVEITTLLPMAEPLEKAVSENKESEKITTADITDIDKQPDEKDVILVVEDNPDVRKYIREPLEPFYTVVEAADGKEGIAKAREIIPDLIVSDIMMPRADGYELCRELKKDIATSHIPIILLTARASEESIIQGLETGADDYVTKPFNSRILLTRIKNLIDLRRQLQLKIQRRKMLLPSEITVSSMDDKFLQEFQGIIEKNLSDPDFDVDKLCDKMYMGRSTLFRKVKALTGETPNQFILSYRLERGAKLLRENYGNVTEVAFAVGFSSSTYFATCFKDKFGQAPSSYQAAEFKTP